MSRLLFLSEVSWAGMSWEPTEVKHCIYVSIYRFHSLMHDLYRPAQVCTIFYHWFKSKKYKYVKSTWNTPCLRKKAFSRTVRGKNASKKIRAEFRTKQHFTKNESLHCGLVLKAYIFRFICFKWVVVDSFGKCSERKEKSEKKQQQKKELKLV